MRRIAELARIIPKELVQEFTDRLIQTLGGGLPVFSKIGDILEKVSVEPLTIPNGNIAIIATRYDRLQVWKDAVALQYVDDQEDVGVTIPLRGFFGAQPVR